MDTFMDVSVGPKPPGRHRAGLGPADGCGGARRPGLDQKLAVVPCPDIGLPVTSPKAQFVAFMDTEMSIPAGTLTATGTKPRPHVEPGKSAFASGVPNLRSLIVNSGDLPTGSHTRYSSPAPPK